MREGVFRLSPKLPRGIASRAPDFDGAPIQVIVRPKLTAHRGRLLSGSHKGTPVHAGSFLRDRRIVLEYDLLRMPHRLDRIFLHEVFHFVWWRLGNRLRRSYEELLASEIRRGAKGELGWSAELCKLNVSRRDAATRSIAWRAYACESFCDTAAWHFGTVRRYAEMTLPEFFRRGRSGWMGETLPSKLRV
jgi:hypothetical protein